MYKMCVFDMDGTVVNSLGDIAAAMNRSLAKMGYPVYEEDDYRRMVGNGMALLCRRAIEGESEEKAAELIKLYNADYLKNCCVKTIPYDGMVNIAEELGRRGTSCAILSNKPQEQAEEIAGKLFSDGLFCEILGQSERFPVKPAPDALFYLMKKYGADKSDTAYIGDSDVDIQLGRAAGVFTVGVTWGFRSERELTDAGADIVVHTADDLRAALMN